MNKPMIDITAVILGAGTLISTLGLGFLQYRLWKAQAKETETKAQTNLIDAALKISEREVAVLRLVNDDLDKSNDKKNTKIDELEKAIEIRDEIIDKLKLRLRMYEDTQPLKKEVKDDSSKEGKQVQPDQS